MFMLCFMLKNHIVFLVLGIWRINLILIPRIIFCKSFQKIRWNIGANAALPNDRGKNGKSAGKPTRRDDSFSVTSDSMQ